MHIQFTYYIFKRLFLFLVKLFYYSTYYYYLKTHYLKKKKYCISLDQFFGKNFNIYIYSKDLSNIVITMKKNQDNSVFFNMFFR